MCRIGVLGGPGFFFPFSVRFVSLYFYGCIFLRGFCRVLTVPINLFVRLDR